MGASQNQEFLPQLQRLSFLLDLHPKESTLLAFQRKQQREKDKELTVSQTMRQEPAGKKYKVSTEELRAAKRACEQIWRAAAEREIAVEPFCEEFVGTLKPLDDRWDGM